MEIRKIPFPFISGKSIPLSASHLRGISVYLRRSLFFDCNCAVLRNALYQLGPWAGQPVPVTMPWVQEKMEAAIRRIDWVAARNDVQRFLPLREQEGLRAWSTNFFLHHLGRMIEREPQP